MNRAVAFVALLTFGLTGCFVVPGNRHYEGPDPRPKELFVRYGYSEPYALLRHEVIAERDEYTVHQITLGTEAGETILDYYQNKTPNEELIFVFPVLGGRPLMSRYFAGYFAAHGFDCAIVHRSNEFKDPNNFERIEQLFIQGVIRDRNAIDFFQKELGKKRFGTFGISRGGINVAITAGVDERLEFNLIALAGADLPRIFRDSSEGRIQKYMETVSESYGMTPKEIIEHLEGTIATDPKYLARYVDGSKVLLFLALCDSAVPKKYGELLRSELGKPETIYLMAGHKTSALYTQVAQFLLPLEEACFLPVPYLESEAVQFFRRSFGKPGWYPLSTIPWKVFQFPFNVIAYALDRVTPQPEDSFKPQPFDFDGQDDKTSDTGTREVID